MNRPRTTPRARLLAGTLVLALTVAGCGADAGAQDPAAEDGKSPLAPYLGEMAGPVGGGAMRAVRIGGDREPTEEDLAKRRKVEDATATCMQQAGFRYQPLPVEAKPKSAFDDAFNLPPDKFAEQYGYGISTIDFSKAGQNENDPNTAIRNALSATAKKAYDKALNGDLGTGGGAVTVERGKGPNTTTTTNTGCRGKAAEKIFGEPGKGMPDMNRFDALFKDVEALRKRIEADARVATATKAWSDCMADGGKPGIAKPEDAPTTINERMTALTGQKKSGVMTPPSFDDVDPTALAKLRKDEIELAKLDRGCRAKHYDEAYKTAQFELEKEFVEAHKAELERYRDTMAEATGPK